ncbi:PREDICTED: 60 kDa SS-A/Ro ribonucleoprotein-like [Acropora digitifera]|uniref:60 kDa SS-A/Ro ribonucleoprotein-like n=1 Tax=Acropora digitifera TaxID=70779 RepID=UPI00077A4A3D|nr:PREDICTED: 60 kDa SS-A/Ro ribonucleoprotein-like [Acropora digitifera]
MSATETPPQSQQLSSSQTQNEAGGFVWKVDDFERLRRFLVLGSEGGTYYAKERKVGKENAQALLRLIGEGRGPEAVKIIVDYSTEGRTAKQDPIILCLAICARSMHMETKRAAYAAITQVLRIPTHLFMFVELCETLSKPTSTGWGRAHRKAIQKWYTEKNPRNLAVAVTKYKRRNKWSHRDLFRLCHIKPKDPGIQFVVKYVMKGFDAVRQEADASEIGEDVVSVVNFLNAVEEAKWMDQDQLVQAIKQHGLVREHIPTQHLNTGKFVEPTYKRYLLAIDVSGSMSSSNCIGTSLTPRVASAAMAMLIARTEPQYHFVGFSNTLVPLNINSTQRLDTVIRTIDQFVEPTYKRYLLAIDVSGSMSSSNCIGTSLTPRVASAAMAMLIARTEPQYHFVGFSNTLVPLNINSTQRLDTVIRTIDQVNSGLNNKLITSA